MLRVSVDANSRADRALSAATTAKGSALGTQQDNAPYTSCIVGSVSAGVIVELLLEVATGTQSRLFPLRVIARGTSRAFSQVTRTIARSREERTA